MTEPELISKLSQLQHVNQELRRVIGRLEIRVRELELAAEIRRFIEIEIEGK